MLLFEDVTFALQFKHLFCLSVLYNTINAIYLKGKKEKQHIFQPKMIFYPLYSDSGSAVIEEEWFIGNTFLSKP